MRSMLAVTPGFSLAIALLLSIVVPGYAQVPPSEGEINDYRNLHKAAHNGDVAAIRRIASQGPDLEMEDAAGRTPLHVAAFASQEGAVRALAVAGADLNALDGRRYDIVTIAAVANDVQMVDLALSLGADPRNVTSPYDGTALIAAAHLGHHEVVKRLIDAGAPLDHVNNLGWTALMEAVVLGDGGADQIETLRALVDAGADSTIADRQGDTPLGHARARGYSEMIAILGAAQQR